MIRINYIVTNEAAVAQRDLNRFLKAEWTGVGEMWHKRFRRPHFTMAAYVKYGYAPRSKRYEYFKRRSLHHNLPLVLSGTSRQLSEQKNVTATKQSVNVRMPVRVFNFKSKNSKVDKRKEFTTVIPEEIKTLESGFQRGIERQFKQHRKQREVKV
jgi:hypothetical protein